MQLVLSIDVSSEPARLLVMRLTGKELEVVADRAVAVSPLFGAEILARPSIPLTRPIPVESPAVVSQVGSSAIDTAVGFGEGLELSLEELAYDGLIRLREAVSELSRSWNWTAAAAVVPCHDYFSLNLPLPFGDNKTLGRILDLEVQDLVPFDLADFLIEHRAFDRRATPAAVVSAGSASGPNAEALPFDVHVSAIPKRHMRNLLDIFRFCEIHPVVVTSPSTNVATVFHLAKDYFPENSVVVHEANDYLAVCFQVHGKVRRDRLIRKPAQLSQDAILALAIEIKLSLASTERLYGIQFEQLYFSGSDIPVSALQQVLARNIEIISLEELCKAPGRDAAFAGLASVLVADSDAAPVLTNFRTREFSFGPQLKNFVEALARLKLHAAAAVFTIMLCLALIFGVRAYRIHVLRQQVHDHIASVIPTFTAEPGQEVVALDKINQDMNTELETLGSPSKFTPLDSLVRLAADLPLEGGVQIRQLQIRGSKISFTASANTYGPVDDVERALRKKSQIYCRVKREQGSSGGTAGAGVTFSLEVILCE